MKDQFLNQMQPTGRIERETDNGLLITHYCEHDGVNYVYARRDMNTGKPLDGFWQVYCVAQGFSTVIHVHDTQVDKIDIKDMLHVVFHDRYAKAVSKGEADINIETAF